jgi:hypothetical protein
MEQSNRKPKHKKEFIDFRKLTDGELRSLSRKWESAARVFDMKLDSYMSNPGANTEKVDRLWKVGDALWRRLSILERWRIRNNKR